MTEKDTSSGRDIREYLCPGCGNSDWEVHGTAMWKVLSNDWEEWEREKAVREAAEQAASKAGQPKCTPGTPDSAWDRIRSFFHRERP